MKRFGFTIVELIITVTIIAILATITIFAFGSWRQRTATTDVKAALVNLTTALKNERNFNGSYPSSIPASYQPSNNVTLTYTLTAGHYCANAVSKLVSSVEYYIVDTSDNPQPGAC